MTKKIVRVVTFVLIALFAGYLLTKFTLEVKYASDFGETLKGYPPPILPYNQTVGFLTLFFSIIHIMIWVIVADYINESPNLRFTKEPLMYSLKMIHENLNIGGIVFVATIVSYLLWFIAKYNDQFANWIIK